MKNPQKKLIKRTPIYSARRAQELEKWERSGRPIPPPHIVKQLTIRHFAEVFGTRVLIETGTYYGDMVEAMKHYFNQIYSIELSKDLYEKAKRRFADDDNIMIIHGDSGVELEKLIAKLDEPALFWLDGHYSAGVTARGVKDTPIYEELEHIFSSPQKGHVIIIDDARCFGADPAYPSINELCEFIRPNYPNAKITVENDSIRIIP
ncbi:hypothetical protein NLA06_12320 [Desulfomicrobium sp. ZS1]|uniref:hypothetical protein n=1 Tax=Desulfomicrobium sp. ZS1 TaxID=2952228 RepID=UPI0020B3A844|nr:hypothetical protein [Desulfomicrobium sp. ZS1]UTF49341.1 hypothetical protein NLA06_12320 [Desulfomicrobium sp. ZS1]